MAGGMRIDSFPENGSPPGADLELMQRQHLDANGVEVGMLIALCRGGMEERNLDFAAALSTAANDWQLAQVVRAGAAACAPPSWCRRSTPSTPWPRSSGARPIRRSCRS